MQLQADWNKLYQNAKALEADLFMKFEGPGLYDSNNECLIVVPEPKELEQLNIENIWHWTWPEETPYRVYMYSCKFVETMLGALSSMPTRR